MDDLITIIVVPFGAVLGAVSIYYILGYKGDTGRNWRKAGKALGEFFGPLARYVYVPLAVIVFILGIVYGGIDDFIEEKPRRQHLRAFLRPGLGESRPGHLYITVGINQNLVNTSIPHDTFHSPSDNGAGPISKYHNDPRFFLVAGAAFLMSEIISFILRVSMFNMSLRIKPWCLRFRRAKAWAYVQDEAPSSSSWELHERAGCRSSFIVFLTSGSWQPRGEIASRKYVKSIPLSSALVARMVARFNCRRPEKGKRR